MLRQERERRALTIQQAAEELHLDPVMIEAIEANRFHLLGAPVYARGHLRKYASVLGLSPQRIIERYDELSDVPAVPTPVPVRSADTVWRERSSLKLPLRITMALLALGAGWGLYQLYQEQAFDIAPATVQAPLEVLLDEPASSFMADSGEVAQVAVGEAPSEPSGEPASTAQSDTVMDESAQDASGIQPIRLHLAFSAPSWTEIYDASGRQLMFGTGAPGTTRTIDGVPPLRVILGFASAVSAQVDERQIVIPRRAGKDAAKFVIAADGTVNNE
jgi:cytoskeleton protein RodZ